MTSLSRFQTDFFFTRTFCIILSDTRRVQHLDGAKVQKKIQNNYYFMLINDFATLMKRLFFIFAQKSINN